MYRYIPSLLSLSSILLVSIVIISMLISSGLEPGRNTYGGCLSTVGSIGRGGDDIKSIELVEGVLYIEYEEGYIAIYRIGDDVDLTFEEGGGIKCIVGGDS